MTSERLTLASPHPKLLPGLHQFLHRASAGNTIVYHSATGVGSLIGVPDGFSTKAGQSLAHSLQFGWGENIVFFVPKIRLAGHNEQRNIFAFSSLSAFSWRGPSLHIAVFIDSLRLYSFLSNNTGTLTSSKETAGTEERGKTLATASAIAHSWILRREAAPGLDAWRLLIRRSCPRVPSGLTPPHGKLPIPYNCRALEGTKHPCISPRPILLHSAS